MGKQAAKPKDAQPKAAPKASARKPSAKKAATAKENAVDTPAEAPRKAAGKKTGVTPEESERQDEQSSPEPLKLSKEDVAAKYYIFGGNGNTLSPEHPTTFDRC